MKGSTIEGIIADMKSGVYDFTKDGKCSMCGECCSNVLPITDHELKRIKQYVKSHHIKDQSIKVISSDAVNMMCPFRDEGSRKCVIYGIRPMICKEFRCDKPSKGKYSEGMMKYYNKYEVNLVFMREEIFGND